MHLRDLAIGDLDAMVALWADPDVGRFMDDFGPRTADEVVAWLRVDLESSRNNRSRRSWVIIDDDDVVGLIMFGPSGRGVGDIDFAYLLRPEWRGRGLESAALREVVAFCFASLGVGSVWGECRVDNVASARVMEKAGLTYIGEVDGLRRYRVESPGGRRLAVAKPAIPSNWCCPEPVSARFQNQFALWWRLGSLRRAG